MDKNVKIYVILLLLLLTANYTIQVHAETTTPPTQQNPTSQTSKTKNNAANTNEDIFEMLRRVMWTHSGNNYAFYVMLAAVTAVVVLYIWFTPISLGRKSAGKLASFAKRAKVNLPSRYDFLAYVVDGSTRTIKKEWYTKISENLYISTDIANPSFLFVPDHVEPYICRHDKTVTPCGLAFRQGLLSIIIDPRLASTHDLAVQTGLIGLNESELDKLLSTLYTKEEKKLGFVPVSPETKIGISFNVKNMIKGYLTVLRSADEMMIHFLHTANQAESIERFMKTAVKMQETRYSWLKWIAYFIMATAIAIALVSMFL